MTSIRYPILVFFLTLLAANHLGAKNDRGYRTGQQALKSRADFCQYVEASLNEQSSRPQIEESFFDADASEHAEARQMLSRVRSVKRLLKPYLQKPVTLESLPEDWLHLLTEKTLLLKYKKQKLTAQLRQLQNITKKSQNDLGVEVKYQSHRSDFQWPLQVKTIEDALRKTQVQLDRITKRSFTPEALFDLSLELQESSPTPLGLKVVHSNGWLRDTYSLYPAWLIDGQWKLASRHPWLTVESEFLPEPVVSSLSQQQVPEIASKYLASNKAFSPESISSKPNWLWQNDGSFIILGNQSTNLLPTSKLVEITLPSDLGAMALFDMACTIETPRKLAKAE
ncbi:MAG: hypothetical protein HRT45_06795 [Bdellovibrionales bacterium]|nr:hypothetical protein [Bdellovibrionales bacterium]